MKVLDYRDIKRMHSSRMRTARSLTVSPCLVIPHTCPPPGATMHPPEQPCMPPQATTQPPGATTHAPPGSNHTCPPGRNHAHPPGATMHAPPGATTHTPPEQPRRPPPWTECGHTLLKILPCPNFVAGGKNDTCAYCTDTEYPDSCASDRQSGHTWASAKAVCEGMGMHLPIIDTAAAMTFINNKM